MSRKYKATIFRRLHHMEPILHTDSLYPFLSGITNAVSVCVDINPAFYLCESRTANSQE